MSWGLNTNTSWYEGFKKDFITVPGWYEIFRKVLAEMFKFNTCPTLVYANVGRLLSFDLIIKPINNNLLFGYW
jgi:hypothetical protein